MHRFPRRTASFLGAAGAAIAIAACGGGGSNASSPLDEGLSYLPKNAPFVVSIGTDLNGSQAKSLNRIVGRFPFGGQVRSSLQDRIRRAAGNDFATIKSLLGNPFVVGSTSARAFVNQSSGQDRSFVGAIQTKDADKLKKAVEKQGAKKAGDKSGATIYRDGSDVFAVKGDVLVVAGSRRELEAALSRRGGSDHYGESQFDKATKGIPKGAELRTFFDVPQLLRAGSGTASARRVKWVNALTGFGAALTFRQSAIDVDFNLGLRGGLSDADLPFASGSTSPSVVERRGEVGVGVRNPAQIVKFAEAAGKAVDPGGYSRYQSGKGQIEQRLGLSIDNDLLAQLQGDATLTFTVGGKFGARAQLRDPAAFKRTLIKAGKVLPQIAKSATGQTIGYSRPKKGEDFFALATPRGRSVVYGVIGGQFVIANDPKIAGTIARDPASAVPGASGSLAVKADAAQLAQAAIGRLGSRLGLGGQLGSTLVTSALGQLTGWIDSSTSGHRGRLSLSVK